jgi:hypothetical protein
MPIPTNLQTNEVKNAAGTEVQFLGTGPEGRSRTFIQENENPSQPHRIKVQHQETGVGMKKVRRSNIRVDKVSISTVDSLTPITHTASLTISSPVGAIISQDVMKDVLAELMSLVASQGATTTILYDCSGYGADALVNGTL